MTGTDETVDAERRRLLGAPMALGALAAVAAGPARAQATHPALGPLKRIDAGGLNIGYAELGPADGPPVLLMHGWPYDIHTYVEVAPILASKGYRVIVPYLRGYGTTRFLSADTARNGQPSALAVDAIDLMNALKIERAVLAGCDWGARTANIMAALWPERCRALVSVGGYLIGAPQAGRAPQTPAAEQRFWYQFYFTTERGRAGYAKYRHEFARMIWRLASPEWRFDDATFERSAAALDNPDHVDVVISSYRWRMDLAEGEARYDMLEQRLATAPAIVAPTITMAGDATAGPRGDPARYAGKFTGRYQHRPVSGGVGHNLPQEAPTAFAQAVIDVDGFARG